MELQKAQNSQSYPKQKRSKLEEPYYLTSNYTAELQEPKQHRESQNTFTSLQPTDLQQSKQKR